MRMVAAPATQAIYHDFVAARDTYIPGKRMFKAVALDAELDRSRLESALRDIVSAHEILRTCPVTTDDQVVQEIRELNEIDEQFLVTTEWDGTGAAISAMKSDLDNWWADPRQLTIHAVLAISRTGQSYLLCAFNGCCMDGISSHFILDQIRARYNSQNIVRSPAQFTDYYKVMINEGQSRRRLDDWLRLIERADSAVPDQMLKERELATKAWIKVCSFDLLTHEMMAVNNLRLAYSCTRFEVLAVCTELYFRRNDQRPASVGILHGGRRGARSLEVAGLFRTHVMDIVGIEGNPAIGAAFQAQLHSLRNRLEQLAMLPVEEVCLKAGLPGGFRFRDRRLWEVSIISPFSRSVTGTFGDAEIGFVDAPLRVDWYCENGGPTFTFHFAIRNGRVAGALQYVNPPVNDATAMKVIAGVQKMLRFVSADPTAPTGSAPAFHRIVN